MTKFTEEFLDIARTVAQRRHETIFWLGRNNNWKFIFPRFSGPTLRALRAEFNAGLADFGSKGWYLTPLGLQVHAALEQRSSHEVLDTREAETLGTDTFRRALAG